MKKLLSTLTIISALTCPVLAQEMSDTTGGANTPESMGSPDTLASIAAGVVAPEESIAVGLESGAQAGLSLSD